MAIAHIEAIPLALPFTSFGPPAGWGGRDWSALEMLLIRVETSDGIVGWGDAFAYSCGPTVKAAIDHMVAPIACGRDERDIAGLMRDLQRELHLFGRYGITMFALSGLDIALWDIAGKRAGQPLCRLLGGSPESPIAAYASLFRYGDPEIVAERCHAAAEEGYTYVKLHETTEAAVRAAREVLGEELALMVDVNCPWTPEQARVNAMWLRAYDLYWLEEPIFPPEDFESLARLQRETGIPLAAGENACTVFEFRKMLKADAVAYAQPSVTKVGGITEWRKVGVLAEAAGIPVMPHSPYFGPGLLATLHLAAAASLPILVERFHVALEASLYGDLLDPVDGAFAVPSGPGLGAEPDPAVIRSYRTADK